MGKARKSTLTKADQAVEDALLKKATGYTQVEKKVVLQKTVIYQDGKRIQEKNEPVTVEEESYIPPDIRAQLFWLKNRQPQRWKEKPLEEDEFDREDDGLYQAIIQAMMDRERDGEV